MRARSQQGLIYIFILTLGSQSVVYLISRRAHLPSTYRLCIFLQQRSGSLVYSDDENRTLPSVLYRYIIAGPNPSWCLVIDTITTTTTMKMHPFESDFAKALLLLLHCTDVVTTDAFCARSNQMLLPTQTSFTQMKLYVDNSDG